MLKMTGSFLISASLALCSIVAISSSGQPKLAACPKMCACENSFCRSKFITKPCFLAAEQSFAALPTAVQDSDHAVNLFKLFCKLFAWIKRLCSVGFSVLQKFLCHALSTKSKENYCFLCQNGFCQFGGM